MLKSLKFSLIVFIVALIPIGCSDKIKGEESKQPKQDIIGKWESLDKSLVLEFKTDGKLVSNLQNGNFKVDSQSEIVFLDDKHLLGVWERDLPSFEVHVYPEQMVLKRENGDRIQFNRIKD